ncbi:hypothetical protein MTO96_035717 [Rhipicephalus appendiculatus]
MDTYEHDDVGVMLLAAIRRRLVMVAIRCCDYGNAAVHASDDAGSRGNVLEGALLVRRPREVKLLADPRTHDYLRHNITHSLLTAGCMVTTVSPLPEEA